MAGSRSASHSASGLLKVVFLGHLVLSSWGMESPYLVPTGYLYYNLIFMMSLIWAVSCDNVDSASMALLVNCACLVMDAFALTFWPRGGPSRERVYFGIAIANSVLRAITALLLYRLYRDRDGSGSGGLGDVFSDMVGAFNSEGGGKKKEGYQNIGNDQSASSSGSQQEGRGGRGSGAGENTNPHHFIV